MASDPEAPLLNPLVDTGRPHASESHAKASCSSHGDHHHHHEVPPCIAGHRNTLVLLALHLLFLGGVLVLVLRPAGLPCGGRSPAQPERFMSECMHPMGGGLVGKGGGFHPLNATKTTGECAAEMADYWDAQTGQYWVDVARVAEAARAHFENLSETHKPHFQDVIVFDIDETVLSNAQEFQETLAPYRRRRGSCVPAPVPPDGAIVLTKPGVGVTDRPPLAPMLELYKYLYSTGYSLAFVTGRKEDYRQGSMANLLSAGYGRQCNCDTVACEAANGGRTDAPCYIQLFMRTMDDDRPASVFKPEQRRAIMSAGYKLFGNFGDQFSDLDGLHVAPHSFKLPNPGYLIV